ncbi:MAG TPA: Hsp20/alpha crystallin family protein [Woeseiaceae bacterium]|nr:Hsp20/alpha crystallin family protein [Woeseiaceae bacterium]
MNQITRRNPRWLQSDVFGDDPQFLWPVSRLHREMNRLFTDAFRGLDEGGEQQAGWIFNPVVDVEQQEGQYEITVELPGVAMNDINVEMKEDMLVISGSKERKQTTGQGEQQRSERIYGSFQRSFRLPDDAIEDKVNARFADGVLTVSIPRDESQSRMAGRRIEVQHASGGAESRERIQQSSSSTNGGSKSGRRDDEKRSSAGNE